jgi:alpha-galactosidase
MTKTQDKNIVTDLLINLRYLVKHIAFKEESECRVIRVETLQGNDLIKIAENGMYIEGEKLNSKIDKVYFAPRAAGYDLFKDRVIHESLHIDCYRCTHPYAQNE